MAKKLFSNDKLRRRLVESLNVIDLLENVGRETILGLYNSPIDNLTELANSELDKLVELIAYCNAQFDKISLVYKVQQFHVNTHSFKHSYYKR